MPPAVLVSIRGFQDRGLGTGIIARDKPVGGWAPGFPSPVSSLIKGTAPDVLGQFFEVGFGVGLDAAAVSRGFGRDLEDGSADKHLLYCRTDPALVRKLSRDKNTF